LLLHALAEARPGKSLFQIGVMMIRKDGVERFSWSE
jgi:hypothetical protein